MAESLGERGFELGDVRALDELSPALQLRDDLQRIGDDAHAVP